MAGIDEVQLRADDDYAFEGDIADDSELRYLEEKDLMISLFSLAVETLKSKVTKKRGRGFGGIPFFRRIAACSRKRSHSGVHYLEFYLF